MIPEKPDRIPSQYVTFNRNNESSISNLHKKSDSNFPDYDMFCQEAIISANPSQAELHSRQRSIKSDHSGYLKNSKKLSKVGMKK